MAYLKIVLFSFLIFASTSHCQACTGIKLTAINGSIVHGRTLEFGVWVDTSVTVIPRNYLFVGTTPLGAGLTYRSKYAVVGASAYGTPTILDGVNEKGLAGGVFYFPGFAGYTEVEAQNQSKGVSPGEFLNWILTQFATLEEINEHLSEVIITPTVDKGWGSTPAPFHYIVYDKQGRSLVIEPLDGKLVTYDNPIGVFTNSPTFDWHMTNLRNYLNLSSHNVKPVKIAGLELTPFGQGSGLIGMPGDFTPPSRFIRATLFAINAIPVKHETEAVFQLFHILNQFDIPVGSAREKKGDLEYSDYTLVTTVRDPQKLKYFFKTYNDQNIRMVDLNQFDWNDKKIKTLKTSGTSTPILNISDSLK